MADPSNITTPAPPATNPITETTQTATIKSNLYNDGERLSTFTPSSDENDRQVAYFTIVGTNGKAANKPDDLDREQDVKSYLEELYASLNGNYDKFILLSINESKSEKAQVLSTHGDHFAAIFTGREPTTISISGQLVADYGDRTSWYRTFMDAYTYFFRASRLAKYNNQLKLVLPDSMETYLGYPLNISWSSSADSDILCNFTMGFLVVDRYWTKAKIEAPSALAGSTATASASITKNITPVTLPAKPTNVSMFEKVKDTLKTVNDAVSTAKKYITIAKTVQNVIQQPNTILTSIAAGGVFGAEILRDKEKYQQFVSTVNAVQSTVRGVSSVVNSVTGKTTMTSASLNKELANLKYSVGVVYTANNKLRVLGQRKPKV